MGGGMFVWVLVGSWEYDYCKVGIIKFGSIG